jgi:integrase
VSVHQKPDGRWFVVHRVNGKQKWESFGRGPEAEAAARLRNTELGLGKVTPPASPTITELATAFMQAREADFGQAQTLKWAYKVYNVILPELGHIEAIRLTPHRLDQYIAKRRKTVKKVWCGSGPGRKWKTIRDANGQPQHIRMTTIRDDIDTLFAILNWAVIRGILALNPVRTYPRPRRDDEVIRPPSTAEMQAIYEAAGDHLKRAVALSYWTGLRPGRRELLSLTFDAVDHDRGLILIRSARKGGPVARMVPLQSDALFAIREWQTRDQKRFIKHGRIIHYRRKPITTIKTAWRGALKRAGITRRLPPYSMRHYFATAYIDQTGDHRGAADILGHARVDTTLRVYRHTSLAHQREQLSNMPRLTLDPLDKNGPKS